MWLLRWEQELFDKLNAVKYKRALFPDKNYQKDPLI